MATLKLQQEVELGNLFQQTYLTAMEASALVHMFVQDYIKHNIMLVDAVLEVELGMTNVVVHMRYNISTTNERKAIVTHKFKSANITDKGDVQAIHTMKHVMDIAMVMCADTLEECNDFTKSQL